MHWALMSFICNPHHPSKVRKRLLLQECFSPLSNGCDFLLANIRKVISTVV